MKQKHKELLEQWREFRESLLKANDIDASLSVSEIARHRSQLEQDPIEWMRFFFAKWITADFADFQKQAIRRIVSNLEWYEVLSWSRELAKSTITMFCVLYLVLTGKKKNVLLVSNSKENADRLLEPYRVALDSNLRIRQYYGQQEQPGKWEIGEFVTLNGASFRAIGAGQSPRGSRNEQYRPDVIIIDDFDTDEECRNPDIINKKWEWFENALYFTRSASKPTTIIWCGNIIAKDCCITRAGAVADNWDIVNIRDKYGKSTWPQKNSEEAIDRLLSKVSLRAAQQECFNNPLAVGDVFKEMIWGKIPPLHKFRFLVSYADPAPANSKNKKSSFKANFLVGCLNGTFYVITGYLDHVSNSEFVDWFYYIHQYVNNKTQTYYYIENNSMQDPFYQQVFIPLFIEKGKQHGFYLSINSDERKKPDKFSRIEGNLEPLNRQNRLILNEKEKENPHMKRLEEQFLLITPQMKAPADGPDCIEGAVWIINQKMQAMMFQPRIGKERKINSW